jgi:hypothetical protein
MKKILYTILILAISFSCTDLTEEVYDTVVVSNFYKTEEQVLSAAGAAYNGIRAFPMVFKAWGLSEFSSDIMMIPTRGSDWYNSGIYQRFHHQEWTTEDGIIKDTWEVLYGNISTCNRLLYQFENVEEKSDALLAVIEEIKGLRAFYYYWLCDFYGNVPLVTKYDVPDDFAPENNTREEVYNFVEEQLLNAIPAISGDFNASTYGRFHRWAAYATLAKLYLNSEVFIGEPRWNDCIEICDEIINSGNFSVSDGDYFSNFAIENENSKDNIFSLVYDDVYTEDWSGMLNIQCWTLHFQGNKAYGGTKGGWNGICGTPSFVKSYDQDDVRLDSWAIGLQLDTSGDTIYCTKTSAGQPLIYSVDVQSLENAREEDGARIAKFDYTGYSSYCLNSDYPVFRYADILLMKAEALMRLNGGAATSEAVDLVNQVRARAFPDNPEKLYTVSTLTLESLLAERGWEFAGEHWRRNDLIRFGKFLSGTWTFKEETTAEYRKLFPIPQSQLNANPNLKQNPGYE